MAKVSFLLHQPKADKATPVFAFLSYDGQRTKIYTGFSIHPKQWNKDDQRALTRGYPLNGATNDALDLLQARLLQVYAECRAVGTLPTADQLRALAEPETPAPAEKPAPLGLLDTFADWIDNRGITRTENTLRTNRTALGHLRGFAEKNRYALTFDTVTAYFADRFTTYLLTDVKLVDSSVRKNLYILKNFLAWAHERGLTTRTDFKAFRWHQREPDILALTRDEVNALAALDLSARPALDNARAHFLLGCYTGLRFSDVAQLRPEHILADRIRLTTTKTRETLTLPIVPEARALLARIQLGTFRPLPNQKLNGHLKTLGQLAALDTPTERTRYAGGKRQTELAPKHTFLTMHVSRKTFVTLALEDGIPPHLVMKLTGHRNLKSFNRYVSATEDAALKAFAARYNQPNAVQLSNVKVAA